MTNNMNENTQDRLIDIGLKFSNWILEKAQSVEQFANEQIPPFIQEFLTWKFYENAIDIAVYFITNIFILLVCSSIIRYLYKRLKRRENDDFVTENEFMCHAIPMGIFSVVILLRFIIALMSFPSDNIKDMIKIKVAPKVYLIEEGTKLVKDIKE